MIDSHAHIYLEQFDEDREEILERAIETNITRIYMPNIDHSSIDRMLEVELRNADSYIPMMGLHPCSVDKHFPKELYIVEDWLSKRKWSAIGEIGLDLYWDTKTIDFQLEVLKIQIEWAKKFELPIVIHCREAFDEIFNALDGMDIGNVKGVFHCFTGGEKELTKINELDWYIGIGGVITYKNQSLVDLGGLMKKDRILLETDCPYLSPVPKRGKRNEPSYLSFIKGKLAEVLNMNELELDKLTETNTLEFFK